MLEHLREFVTESSRVVKASIFVVIKFEDLMMRV